MNKRKIKIKWENFVIFILIIISIIVFSTIIKDEYMKFQVRKNNLNNEMLSKFDVRDMNFYIENPVYKNSDNNADENKIIEKLLEKNSSLQTKEAEENNYYLQIGIFSNKDYAAETKERLKLYKSKIIEQFINEKKFYKVIIAEISSREEAENIRKAVIEKTESEVKPLIRVRY